VRVRRDLLDTLGASKLPGFNPLAIDALIGGEMTKPGTRSEANNGAQDSLTASLSSPLVAPFITRARLHGRVRSGVLSGFMEAHGVPWRGELTLCMVFNNNTIFWKGWNSVAAGALAELHERFLIKMYAMTDPDDPITRLEWQSGFPLPLARQPRRIYRAPRFLPVRFFAEGYEPTRNAVEVGEGWTCGGR
jgi:hypothetical protein